MGKEPGNQPEDSPTLTRSESDGSTFGRPLPVSQALTSGQRFGGYLIHRLLGKGGMGEVYEAEQVETGRRVALKVMGDLDPTPQARERFLREGRLAASVNHPHSVYVYGTEEIEGTWVISMELLGGGTLRDRVKTHGPMPPKEAVDAILNVIDGLEAAASAGVLHRDVKPANCFVEVDGTVKIGDFGLSLSTLSRERSAQLTSSGMVIGTPAFASPEQLRGEEVDVRSDIYSVGATLYYLLTGKPPFEGENLMQLLTAIADKRPASPRDLRGNIPRGLSGIVLRCMAKRAAHRPHDYERLKDELLIFGSPVYGSPNRVVGVLSYFLDSVIACAAGLVGVWLWMSLQRGAAMPVANFLRSSLLGGDVPVGSIFGTVALATFGLPIMMTGRTAVQRALNLQLLTTGNAPIGPGARLLVSGFFAAGIAIAARLAPDAAAFPWPVAGLAALMMYSISPWFGISLRLRLRGGGGGVRAPQEQDGGLLSPVGDDAGSLVIGPYRSSSEPRVLGSSRVYDPILRRPVWIVTGDSAAVSPVRRELRRSNRLRWLTTFESNARRWAVFEAPAGGALIDLEAPIQWDEARRILHELACEVVAARADGTIPTAVSVEKVWIGPGLRPRLLDDLPPGSAAKARLYSSASDRGLMLFLAEVAERMVSARGRTALLPRNAHCFLVELKTGAFASFERAAAMLAIQARGTVRLSTAERGIELACFAALTPMYVQRPPFFFWMLFCFVGIAVMRARGPTPKLWPIAFPSAYGLGPETVRSSGRPASPWRVAVRDTLAVAPLSLPWALLGSAGLSGPAFLYSSVAVFAIYALALAGAARGGVGVLGRLTDTRLVPRHVPFVPSDPVIKYEDLREMLDSSEFKEWSGRDQSEWRQFEDAAARRLPTLVRWGHYGPLRRRRV